MPALPSISGKEAIKAFEKAGWEKVRVGSSRHIIMKKKGMATTLSVPDHKILDRGLLKGTDETNEINQINETNETNQTNEINEINQRNEMNQTTLIASMTPERKIRIALDLYESARQVKAAGLRAFHPDWTEEKIQQRVREIFLYART